MLSVHQCCSLVHSLHEDGNLVAGHFPECNISIFDNDDNDILCTLTMQIFTQPKSYQAILFNFTALMKVALNYTTTTVLIITQIIPMAISL